MSKIILVVLLAVVFCLFATVQTSAIAHRRRSRTLTPQAADQVFNSEKEGEHASGEEEPDVNDDTNATKSNGTNVELEDEEEDDDEDDIEEEGEKPDSQGEETSRRARRVDLRNRLYAKELQKRKISHSEMKKQ